MRLLAPPLACLFALIIGVSPLWSAPFDDLNTPASKPAENQPKDKSQSKSAKSTGAVSAAVIESLEREGGNPNPVAIPLPDSEGGLVEDESSSPTSTAAGAFRSGDIDACLSHLRDAVAQKPTLPPPKLTLAGFYLKAGQRRPARAILEELAAKSTKHPQLYLTLSDLAMAEGRLADAEAHLQLLEAEGVPSVWDDAQKRSLQSAILAHQTALAERRQQWDKAAGLLAKWVQLAPQSPALRHRWATALFNDEQLDEAFEQLDIAYRQDVSLGLPEVAMGALHAGRSDYDGAKPWYDRAIAKHPEDANVRIAWAMALLYQNKADEAAAELKQATVSGAQSAQLYILRGIAAREQRDWVEAEANLGRALQLQPGNEEATYHLVLTLIEQNDKAKRSQAAKMAADMVKDHRRSSLAMAAMGAALHAEGNIDEAELALREAAASPLTRPETVYLLGKVLAAGGKNDAAKLVAKSLHKIYLAKPDIFVLRPAARRWMEETLK